MLSIVICDNDQEARTCVRRLCTITLEQLNIMSTFCEFASAESLLLNYPPAPDLIFLDVIMGDIDGIHAAHEIRAKDTVTTIVFMSNYAQFALQGYAVQAYRYLLKPLKAPQFSAEIKDILIKLDQEKKAQFAVHNDKGMFALVPREIKYVETAKGKKLTFHLVDKQLSCRGTLRYWENSLKPLGFFRCHSAFLVNLSHVRSIHARNRVKLFDGEELAVSRHRRKDFMDALSAFVRARI